MNLGSIPPEALALVALVAVAVIVTQALARAVGVWSRGRQRSLRMERAAWGEAQAPAWLEERGYRVLGAQVVVDHPVRIDDRVVAVALRADYLAEKDGARFVVEVKTGALAPRLETSATRRQLLEYRVAFDVDGVVLVDGETGSVHEVTFPALARFAYAPASGGGWLLAFALAAAAVVVLLARLA